MRRLFLSLFIVTVISGCGIFGNDGSDRFGAWEKVSSDRGEYRGTGSKGKIQAVASGISYNSTADTIQIDTSYVNSDKQLDISLSPNDLTQDRDYDVYMQMVDSTAPHPMHYWKVEYLSDSTAFNAMLNDARLRASGVLEVGTILEYNCGSQQAENEILNIEYATQDSSQITVYQVQADGMLDIVKDIIPGCKD